MGVRIPRRRFFKRSAAIAAAAGVGALGICGYAGFIEPGWLSAERIKIRLRGLSRAANGFRLAFLSDLHVGPHVSGTMVQRAIEISRVFEPRLLLLGGDYVYHSAGYARAALEAITDIRPPDGILAVMGNHDYWTNGGVVAGALHDGGITVLRNDAREILQGLWIAGVDDVFEGRARLELALKAVPGDACTILLAHEPDFADEAAASGRIALQLSGHSHGGQVRLPLLGPPILPPWGRKYPAGLYRVGSMQLYVTRGVGSIPPPARMFCRPEVTLVELAGV